MWKLLANPLSRAFWQLSVNRDRNNLRSKATVLPGGKRKQRKRGRSHAFVFSHVGVVLLCTRIRYRMGRLAFPGAGEPRCLAAWATKNGVRFTSDVASDEESGCLRALRIRLTHGFECDIPEDGLLAIYELRLPTTRRNPEVSLPSALLTPFFTRDESTLT
ncbi:hypothetical protein [Dyella koreensis]|uniref:Uncharacterized protein n=1 Tax=Dyella koreensis TaxID=311235 RepID=A0ABW8K9N6_9GAMM